MRASATVLALLLLAGSAFAQSSTKAKKPDYSRDSLLKITADVAKDDDDHDRDRFRFGAVDFRALGTTFSVGYLNLMMPLSGTEFDTVMNRPPDPFALTNTQIATGPRAWRTTRERNAELRRIEATERARQKAKVTVSTD